MASGTIVLVLALAVATPAQEPVRRAISDLYVLSDLDHGQIDVRIVLSDDAAERFRGVKAELTVRYPDGTAQRVPGLPFAATSTSSHSPLTVDIDPVLPWHPKTPSLYGLEVVLRAADGAELGRAARRFGMRKHESRDARFFVNNEPFYVRACGHERESICDNLDRAGALKRLRQVKRYGFNAVRHHTHVPSEVYLDACDEVGVLIQMEIGGRIGTDPSSDTFLASKRDWVEMIRRGRRHPCLFIYSMGNEIYKNDAGLIRCQNALYDLAKQMDPAVLVLNRSGSNPFNDDHGKFDLLERPIGEYEHVAEFAREAFMLYLRGDRKGRSDEFPIIAHEYPLVASYPNPELSAKYTEEPAWLTATVENAREHGLEHLLPDFVRNSERIQAVCRKEMLEEARKFRELDGYSMLRFTDCEGRVSGVVDDFADPKNVTAEQFLRTNGETVLLCTWNGRSFSFGDTLEAVLEVSHHGPREYSAPVCRWWLMHGARVLVDGAFESVRVGPVDVAQVGKIAVTVPKLSSAAKLTLRAVLPGTRPLVNNEWHFWAFPCDVVGPDVQKTVRIWDPRQRLQTYRSVYPDVQYVDEATWKPAIGDAGLIITDSWQEGFYDLLGAGGNIWVISDKTWPWPEEIGIFGLHITRFVGSRQAPPVFPELDEHGTKWLTVCSNTKVRHGNSGTLIYPHAALRGFPHDGFCDMQFWPMIYRAKSLQLDRFPPGTDPLIRTIDNYHRGQSKGYMVDLVVGRGHVFVSTLNLTQSFERDVATRHMFDQLLRYLTGPDRHPSARMTSVQLRKMVDDFAVALANRSPLSHDEMPARYSTRWKWLLSPRELITLPVYEAEGIAEERLGVHWEYAQTQWYFDAGPSDRMRWRFSNKSESAFACTVALASPLTEVGLSVQVDGGEVRHLTVDGSDGWEHFVPIVVEVPTLAPGDHTLTLSVPDDAPVQGGRTLQIRSVQLLAESPSD